MANYNAVMETQQALEANLMQKFADLESQLKASAPRSGITLHRLQEEISDFKTHVWTILNLLRHQIGEIARTVEVGEMRHRRKYLLVSGVSEDLEESLPEFIAKLFHDKLGVCGFTSNKFKGCHRLGTVSDGKCRPVLVRFADSADRSSVWRKKTAFKGTPYVLSEFLTRKRQSLFIQARQRFESTTTNISVVSDAFTKSPNDPKITDSAQVLAEAIKSLTQGSNQHYFVSSFDPSINDIDVWCEEVERAKKANNWHDSECLSRVSGCLKGDARLWLNEWITNERTWSNFCKEFKPLFPRKLDYANILFNAMQSTSDGFNTYAEYARRTLLRLKIVKGLSDELRTLIVIRGITDLQVRAAAANANLACEDLVSFLSIYVKPTRTKQENRNVVPKRPMNNNFKPRCFNCGQVGHKSQQCFKKTKSDQISKPSTSGSNLVCSFCQKPGHNEVSCFLKDRSGPRNPRNVNLCAKPSTYFSQNRDLTAAVIQGIPMDVLIDSGALNVSLISSEVLKYFSCERKPRSSVLKGISDSIIESDSFVTLTVEFDEISIEADFVVVPGSYMNTPIIIGTDILNRDGITYIRTNNKQYLTRSPQTSVHMISSKEPIHVNTPLQGTDLGSLMTVIEQFSNYLISGTASTTVTTGKMHIELTNNKPVAYRPYKLSYSEKLKVREIINDLKDKGIVRESTSEYASPIILVKKKDGSDRMCVDYRALNRITVKDRYPLPLIDDHIDRLGNFKYFTSLDMATGFHQIPIDEKSVEKTAFVTPEGHFEYLRMPYGLTNSPIVYQRIINNTLRDHIEAGNVLVYVDDVLIMSDTIVEGIRLLEEVLKTLTGAGFSINLRKCSFLCLEIEYLGRVISQGKVKPSPRKIAALVNVPAPTNVKQVRQFLGLAGPPKRRRTCFHASLGGGSIYKILILKLNIGRAL
ncbi:uncharacterized protein [Epargyreus clarus]|uniref:uncharacterized protein n=1 Tax=Epargyreus clarus TaxID=520877 RepID=UPI003C2B6E78